MTWLSCGGVEASIYLTVDRDAEIKFLVSPNDPDNITLAIGDPSVEISFDPATLETVRDKADQALSQFRRS